MLYNRLKDLPLYNISTESFKKLLKNIAYKLMHKSKSERVFDIFTEEDKDILKKLGNNEELHVTRPDKGRGIVILNKLDYIGKVESLLSDRNTFQSFTDTESPLHKTMKIEDKINRFLRKLKQNNNITETEYKDLYVSGSSPGILYGLPKIHKPNTPVRPIISSVNTPNYKIAKFLIPHINHLSKT